jgi:hypothetical protein
LLCDVDVALSANRFVAGNGTTIFKTICLDAVRPSPPVVCFAKREWLFYHRDI